MAVREIVIYPDDRLRKHAAEVTVFDDELKELVQDMFDSMYHYEGIGLAAPQIGVSRRVVTIDIVDGDAQVEENHNRIVLINPEIVSREGTTVYKEGCLSVPQCYEDVERAEKIVLKAKDADGNDQEFHADGLLAICMQHELDHLNGHVFVDHISTLKRDRITKKMVALKKEREAEALNKL